MGDTWYSVANKGDILSDFKGYKRTSHSLLCWRLIDQIFATFEQNYMKTAKI